MRRSAGFTMLEILLAMSILSILVLMVSAIFNRSMGAWEIGTRKTELNMEGRSALLFMAQELSQAVADPAALKLPGVGGLEIKDGPTVAFYTLGLPDASNRAARLVVYKKSGTVLERSIQYLSSGAYPSGPPMGPNQPLAENVIGLTFTTSDGKVHLDNLPDYLDISLKLQKAKADEYSIIKITSLGPDGASSADDLYSYK